jgi:quercetin dioxygenase-like cupin family protein
VSNANKYFKTIKDIPYIAFNDKAKTRFVLGDQTLVSFIEQEAGAEFPIHSHDCEQILIILEGSEEHFIDGETVHMEAGDVCIHPANVLHGGHTKTGFKGIDIFSPPRKEHLELMEKHGQLKK